MSITSLGRYISRKNGEMCSLAPRPDYCFLKWVWLMREKRKCCHPSRRLNSSRSFWGTAEEEATFLHVEAYWDTNGWWLQVLRANVVHRGPRFATIDCDIFAVRVGGVSDAPPPSSQVWITVARMDFVVFTTTARKRINNNSLVLQRMYQPYRMWEAFFICFFWFLVLFLFFYFLFSPQLLVFAIHAHS